MSNTTPTPESTPGHAKRHTAAREALAAVKAPSSADLREQAAALRVQAEHHRGEAKKLSQAAAAMTMAATALEGGRSK